MMDLPPYHILNSDYYLEIFKNISILPEILYELAEF